MSALARLQPSLSSDEMRNARELKQALDDAVMGLLAVGRRINAESAILGPVDLATIEDWRADNCMSERTFEERITYARNGWE